MYCQNCGKEYSGDAKFCQGCGAHLMNRPVYASTVQSVPQTEPRKELIVALILSIFLGSLGVDRFYLGYVGLGILKLLTCGGCGVWWLIDIVLIAARKLPDSSGVPLL